MTSGIISPRALPPTRDCGVQHPRHPRRKGGCFPVNTLYTAISKRGRIPLDGTPLSRPNSLGSRTTARPAIHSTLSLRRSQLYKVEACEHGERREPGMRTFCKQQGFIIEHSLGSRAYLFDAPMCCMVTEVPEHFDRTQKGSVSACFSRCSVTPQRNIQV